MDPVNRETFINGQLEAASLPKYEEVAYSSLAPGYLAKLNISTIISLLVFSGIAGVGFLFLEDFRKYFPWGFAVLFPVFLWSFITNAHLYKRNGFALRERDIIYKRGFLFEKVTLVPFNRVQHVSTHRSVLDKMLHLSTLKVFTAGGAGSDISLPGLTPETANRLKEALAERMAGHV